MKHWLIWSNYIITSLMFFRHQKNAMNQYNRIADAILTLDTMAERIRIMESEPERSKEMRRLLVDNYSVFFVIQGDKVIVTDVLYSASDIESRLKG